MLYLTDGPIRRPGALIILSNVKSPLIEGQNITLTCSAGRPTASRLIWTRKAPHQLTWTQVVNNSVTTTTGDVRHSLLVSHVKLVLSANDDGVVYRCLATNDDVILASASYTLRVHCKKRLLQQLSHLILPVLI